MSHGAKIEAYACVPLLALMPIKGKLDDNDSQQGVICICIWSVEVYLAGFESLCISGHAGDLVAQVV